MTKQAIADADQAVALTRKGDEWSWHDGQIEGDGFGSAQEALADYLSNPMDESERFVPVSNVSIETNFHRHGGLIVTAGEDTP